MTTERSSFDDPGTGSGAMGDDALGNVDALVGTREDEMTSTGLSDSSFPTGSGMSDSSWATGTGSGSSSSGGDRLQDAAGGVADRVGSTAQQQIGNTANTQLSKASDMLGQVANAVRQSGEQMRQDQPQIAGFADTAAEQVDKASQFLRQTDFQGILREGESFARRQPAVFLGGALALGLLASRFLKASPQGGQQGQFDRGFGSGYGGGSYRGSSYGGSSYRDTSYGTSGSGSSYGTAYGGGYGDQAGAGGYGGGSGYAGAATSGFGDTASGVHDTDEGAEHGRV